MVCIDAGLMYGGVEDCNDFCYNGSVSCPAGAFSGYRHSYQDKTGIYDFDLSIYVAGDQFSEEGDNEFRLFIFNLLFVINIVLIY